MIRDRCLVLSLRQSHMPEFTRIICVKVGQCQVAANLLGQAVNLTLESACRLLQAKHSPAAICIITQP